MEINYTIGSIYHIAKADFLEKVRSYNFLIALGVCIFMNYSFVPPHDSCFTIVSLGNYVGFYNSSWIGGMVAMCIPFFSIAVFYVVNNSVKRDIHTGVGQIIATTPVTRFQYFTGKLISNFTALLLISALIAVMTVVMFLFRGEVSHPEFGELLLPLFIFMIPSMFIIAALGLIFDSLSGLSKGFANIIFFFLWILLIYGSYGSHPIDVFGLTTIMNELKHSILTIHPDWSGDLSIILGITDPPIGQKDFIWEGMHLTSQILLSRIYWMSVAFGLVMLASLGFNRFDTSKIRERKQENSWFTKKNPTIHNEDNNSSKIRYSDLHVAQKEFSFFSLVATELRLMLRGKSTFGMIITAIIFIVSMFTSLAFAYKIALPLLWFFQILTLSNLGSREVNHRCNEYIFSFAFPLRRQLSGTMLAAVILMITLAIPVTLRVILTGNFYGAYAIVAGALFIPVFAIASGILTGSSKFFEVIFTIIVYGILNNVPFFDIAHYLLFITIGLIILAFIARKRQIRNGM